MTTRQLPKEIQTIFECTHVAGWKHFRQDGHTVGNIDHTFILDNLGDKGSVNQIVADWHTDAQDQTVGEFLEHGFHVSLGLTVEGSIKVGFILFFESNATAKRMLVVVLENTSGRIDGAMNATHITQVGQVQGANDIGTDGFGLVRFAPINVGPSGDPGGVEHMGGLDFIEFGGDLFAHFQPAVGPKDFNACAENSGGKERW